MSRAARRIWRTGWSAIRTGVLLGCVAALAQGAPAADPGAAAAQSAAAQPAGSSHQQNVESDALAEQRRTASLSEFPSLTPPAAPEQPPGSLADVPEIQSLYDAAREAAEAGRLDQAVARLDEALGKARQEYYELLYLMAQCKYSLGRLGEARTAAEFAARLRHESADVHYLLGKLHQAAEANDLAIGHFRTATLLADREVNNPRITAAFYELGATLRKLGYTAAAAESWAQFDERIWDSYPEHRSDKLIKAVLEKHPNGMIEQRVALLGELGRRQEAVAAARWAIENHASDAELRAFYVRTLLDAGRDSEALGAARDHLGDGSDETLLQLALTAARGAGALDEWVGELSATAAPNDEQASLIRALARQLDDADLPALAARLWQAVVRAAPDDVEAAASLASALIGAGRFGEAFEAAQPHLADGGDGRLLALAIRAAKGAGTLNAWIDEVSAGDRPGLMRAVALRLDAEAAPAQAARLWSTLAQRNPTDGKVAWALAASLKADGRLDAAVDALASFVRANPQSDGFPWNEFRSWMRRYEAVDELLKLCEQRAARADADFASDFVLGALAAAGRQTLLAEKLLEASLAKRPGFAPAHVVWGAMLLDDYRWEDALGHANKAVEAAPNLGAARFVAARALAGLDRNDAATAAFEKAVELAPDEPAYAIALAEHHWRLYQRYSGHAGEIPGFAEQARAALLAVQRYYQAAADAGDAQAVEGLIDAYLAAGKVEIAKMRLAAAEQEGLPEDVLRRLRTTLTETTPEQYLAELERQYAEHPADSVTGLRLAEAYEVLGRFDDAFEVIQRLHKLDADDERIQSVLTRLYVRRLDYDAAIELLEGMRRRYPNRLPVIEYLARVYHNDVRMADARELLERAIELSERETEQLNYRAQILETYYRIRDFNGAIEFLKKWEEAAPVDRRDAIARSRWSVLQSAGRGDEAVEQSAQWVEQAPGKETRLERLVSYAYICRAAKAWDKADKAVVELIDARPEAAELVQLRVEILIEAERYDAALAALDALRPEQSVLKEVLKARCHAAAGRVDEALAIYESLMRNPAAGFSGVASSARVSIIDLLVNDGQFDRALQFIEQWEAAAPEAGALSDVVLLRLRAHVLQGAGRDDEYIPVMQKLLELSPNDPGFNNDLGYSWVDRGERLEQATRMIRLAVAAEPLNSSFLDSLGWAYYKAGDFSLARKYLERSVLLLDGDSPVVYDHLADADYRLGDAEAARKHWRKALELIEQEDRTPTPPGRPELTASIREKLQALDAGVTPETAPLGEARGNGQR